MSLVLNTCSYAFGFKLDPNVANTFARLYCECGVRFNVYESISELQKDLERVRYLVCVHTDEVGYGAFNAQGDKDILIDVVDQNPETSFMRVFERSRPSGLYHLVGFAIEKASTQFLGKLGSTFQPNETLAADADLAVQCDSRAGSYLGRCVISINEQKLVDNENASFLRFLSREALIDSIKEFANQFLGVVNQCLVRLGYLCRVGLPFVFSNREMVKKMRSGIFIPSVNFESKGGGMEIQFGFVHTMAGLPINLDQLKIDHQSIGAIDFL